MTNSKATTSQYNATIGGKTVSFLVDSGAADNVIDTTTYTQLHDNVTLQPTRKQLFAFGQTTPLKMIGQFLAEISVNGSTTNAVFYVFDGKACNLLCSDTASKLKVKFLSNVCTVSDNSDL